MSRHSRLEWARGLVCALVLVGVSGAVGPTSRSALAATSAAPHALLTTRSTVNPVFRPILPRLKGLAIPVLLPTMIPRQNQGGLHLYATVDDHGQFSYLINLGFAPDCHGATACRFGEVTGGPEVDTPTIFDYPRGRQLHLHNGALALYYPFTCGASCGDSVLVFQVDGVVYTVSLKAGSQHDVLSMANSFALAIAP